MHLILTHEQADFDAVAALYAARQLEPEALGVLPRRLNRNLRAFLTLYGDRLALHEFEDLKKGKVDRLTLVDTQVLPSLKGFGPWTQVHIVDHHPPSPSLDPGWSRHIEPVGATTTLLVEAMENAGERPDLVGASFLLLGIYEDTGSLSYPGTTARDMRAAAWLLDAGASLTIASDFLNHPLSPAQQDLYDQLLENAETLTIHGLSVVIASAHAPGLTDEVSTLAHKLRDLFDPAGLFVLVALDGHVQLVARSTSEAVDVGRISERFGGGGHERAAAALIRDRRLSEVRKELEEELARSVQPATTVEDIMSRGPALLDPSVPIREASERMQRFGHEGYPVVDHGRVVGLLTRRAVDRAMAHRMGEQPIRSVMEPGSVVVHPQDSVQHLQRVMIQHDWGQVPVADSATGQIVGIVTRTDLLRSLAGPETERAPASLADELERALPPRRLALLHLVARQAETDRVALYVVGGFVRDLLLRQPGADLDLVVEGDAIALARRLAAAYGGRVSGHDRFRTAKWRLDPDEPRLLTALGAGAQAPGSLPPTVDFVSARAEFYSHPTALPSVQLGSIKLDLHRRDFSINTLALRLDGNAYGQLLDPWGGGADLRERRIRVLHSISFIDDPTRMLRAVRLEQRLGFTIEPRTLRLLHEALPLLHRVSGERLRNELELVFHEPRLTEIMTRLDDLGLLRTIHPGLTWDEWLRERFAAAADFQPPQAWKLAELVPSSDLLYILWLLRLDSQAIEVCTERLHMPLRMANAVRHAGLLWRGRRAWEPPAPPSRVVEAFDGAPESTLVGLWLAFGHNRAARQTVDDYLSRLRFLHPKTTGDDLQAMGLPPGPEYGRLLMRLRQSWLDGQITDEAGERRLLEQLLRGQAERG
ncbi:MAG TPA: CBS domain-containing protein [Anaerolineales bacterium]|nr:CBS domain-containing protein [Anaerolineales bacterium]